MRLVALCVAFCSLLHPRGHCPLSWVTYMTSQAWLTQPSAKKALCSSMTEMSLTPSLSPRPHRAGPCSHSEGSGCGPPLCSPHLPSQRQTACEVCTRRLSALQSSTTTAVGETRPGLFICYCGKRNPPQLSLAGPSERKGKVRIFTETL